MATMGVPFQVRKAAPGVPQVLFSDSWTETKAILSFAKCGDNVDASFSLKHNRN